ncbi:MAG: hypothetical protein ACFFBY_15780 [Promethearchaeota archaeon]
MEKPLSYFDWELRLRSDLEPKNSQILSQEDMLLKHDFNNLIKCFSKKESLFKSGGIISSQFNFINMNLENGLINCRIQDQSSEEFKLEINKKKRFIHHQCQEFLSLNKFKKQFCSHLIRLFFILREVDMKGTNELLKHISSHDYDFFPKIRKKKRN